VKTGVFLVGVATWLEFGDLLKCRRNSQRLTLKLQRAVRHCRASAGVFCEIAANFGILCEFQQFGNRKIARFKADLCASCVYVRVAEISIGNQPQPEDQLGRERHVSHNSWKWLKITNPFGIQDQLLELVVSHTSLRPIAFAKNQEIGTTAYLVKKYMLGLLAPIDFRMAINQPVARENCECVSLELQQIYRTINDRKIGISYLSFDKLRNAKRT